MSPCVHDSSAWSSDGSSSRRWSNGRWFLVVVRIAGSLLSRYRRRSRRDSIVCTSSSFCFCSLAHVRILSYMCFMLVLPYCTDILFVSCLQRLGLACFRRFVCREVRRSSGMLKHMGLCTLMLSLIASVRRSCTACKAEKKITCYECCGSYQGETRLPIHAACTESIVDCRSIGTDHNDI